MAAPVRISLRRLSSIGLATLLSVTLAALQGTLAADSINVGGRTYINKGLVAVGRLPADLRDKFGETVGSGSGLAANPKTWSRARHRYRGTIYMLPDRGYNVSGSHRAGR